MAYGVRSEKFLCCLPVRIGVFVLALLQAVLAGFLAAALWVAVARHHGLSDYTVVQRISVYLIAVLMTLLSIFSLFGFLGSVIRKRSFVRSFARYLTLLFVLSLGAGIFTIVLLFTESRDKLFERCVGDSTDQHTRDVCDNVTAVRAVTLGWIVANWLVSLYMIVIVRRYVRQLEEEDAHKFRLHQMNNAGAYTYQPTGRGSGEYLNPKEGNSFSKV